MDLDHVASIIQSLSATPSRRRALRLLAGSGLGGLLTLGGDTALAKKGKGKKGKKKREGDCPSPPSRGGGGGTVPQAAFDAACLGPADAYMAFNSRVAQTFIALHSGKLTRAQFVLTAIPDGADIVVEIRDVNASGEPTSTVLATTSVDNVPATPITPSPVERPVAADFASPATVVAGQAYALAISRASGFGLNVHQLDMCSDGELFDDRENNNSFTRLVDFDMVYATFVRV